MTGQEFNGPELTPREREVLAMVAEGLTNREIGAALFISENTAGVHVSNIMAKLGAGSRTEAAALAIRAGLVEGVAAPLEASVPSPAPAEGEGLVALEPGGWLARLRMQFRRHPRSAAVAGGGVILLSFITATLAFSVINQDRPAGAVGGSPTPSPSGAASASPSPSSSATATASPSGSPSAEPSASASAEIVPSAEATPEPTATPLGRWTATGELLDPRFGHTATLLGDGSVLVIGGNTGAGIDCLETVEHYNPQSGRWIEEAEMSEQRCGHLAMLLADGEVLVMGGPRRMGPSSRWSCTTR